MQTNDFSWDILNFKQTILKYLYERKKRKNIINNDNNKGIIMFIDNVSKDPVDEFV